MLNEAISISVIDKIFKSTLVKLGTNEMMLYMNVLNHHFSKLEENPNNLGEFEILKKDIPQFDTYKKRFEQLERAGLVNVLSQKVIFLNVWSKHISMVRVENSAVFQRKYIEEYREKLFHNKFLRESIRMKTRLSEDNLSKLMEIFFSQMSGVGKQYSNEQDARNHLYNWCLKNTGQLGLKKSQTSSKILGRN